MQGLILTEINQIQQRLALEIRKNDHLQEEVLDHLCCLVEELMQGGSSFETAINQAFESFGEQGLSTLELQVNQVTQTNNLLMKQLSLLTLLFTVGLSMLMHYTQAQDVPEIAPVPGPVKVVSGFGMRMHPILKEKKHHFGVDLRADMGTEVLATAHGKVVKAQSVKKSSKPGYGNYVRIQHKDGYETLYSQLSEIKVEEGQEVKQGDVIGLSGSSGVSTGPHLHYEVIHQGKRVNPEAFLKKG